MSKQPNQEARDHEAPRPQSSAVLLLADIADTTWRMFVPTIGLTVFGLWLDKQFGSSPWLLITGIVIGSGLAALLVRRQLERVKRLR